MSEEFSNIAKLFGYIFVHLRQKARLRPELSPKFLPTLGPNPARTRPEPDPKSPARLTTLVHLLQIQCSLAQSQRNPEL